MSRARELIDAWLDETLDEGEALELEQLLATSDPARRDLVLACRLHAALAAGHAALPRLRRSAAPRWAAAAAALLALALGALAWSGVDAEAAPAEAANRRVSIRIDKPAHPLPERQVSKLASERDHRIRL